MRKRVGAKRRTVLACWVRRVRAREAHLLLSDSGHQASLDRYTGAGHAHRVHSHNPTLILRVTTAIELGPSSSLRGEGRLDHLALRLRRALKVGPGGVRFLPSMSGSLGASLAEVGYLVVFLESRHLVKGLRGDTQTRRRETKSQRSPRCRKSINRRGVDRSNLQLRVLGFALNPVRVRYLPNGLFRH